LPIGAPSLAQPCASAIVVEMAKSRLDSSELGSRLAVSVRSTEWVCVCPVEEDRASEVELHLLSESGMQLQERRLFSEETVSRIVIM
jgi:hypothetical protein